VASASLPYFFVMPAVHAEVVTRACRAWCEGDISIYREMYAPDVVAEGGGLWPEGEGSIRGVDAVIGNFELILAAFERSELIPEEFVEDGDSLAVQLLWRGVIPGTATPVEQHVACAYRFRDGLIVHTAWYPEFGEALAALGLPPDASGSSATRSDGGA
jgi:ketosteroid isomerase-like protein